MVADQLDAESVREAFVAESMAMRELLELARRVARGVIPVLLHGETGTGKEVLARFMHDSSRRSEGPLVAVNCAAIPSQLIESTLFGHVRGAFTGASQAHAGVFEAASGGTVLLDEIGELPAAAQAALLRVLETKTVTRVGSTKEVPIDVRIIAASHRDLAKMVDAGTFREDVLYRLNAVTLEIPPLRERREDVAPLAELFLREASRRNERSMQPLDESVRSALCRHTWPGNIRQLRNAIERAVVIADHDTIRLRDLPAEVRPMEAEGVESASSAETGKSSVRRTGETFRACIERVERELIVEALELTEGNQSEAARDLDMPRRTFVHKLRTFGIKKGD
jgi:DNA-binding NtrC family response regulator